MGLEVFSEMATIVEALLTNGAAVASRCFALLVGVFTDVMVLEVLPSVKASVAHSTRKAVRLTMNSLTMPLQTFLSMLLDHPFFSKNYSKICFGEVKGTTITKGKKICNP